MISTDSRVIRRFGIIALVFFGGLCILGMLTGKPFPAYLFGTLSVIGLGFIVMPVALRPLYAGWIRIAHYLGKAVNLLVLTVAYYAVITPSASIKRLFGGIPLPLKPEKSRSSYWVDRSEPVQPRERFVKRY